MKLNTAQALRVALKAQAMLEHDGHQVDLVDVLKLVYRQQDELEARINARFN